ncbi:putative RNA-directed DNA polymerase [Tanacetum coccineum]
MLISIWQLDDEGHHVIFGNHQWKVTKGNLVVARGQKRGTLYMVEVSDDEPHAVEKVGAPTLWHQRLGHMSEKGMKMLVSIGRIPDLKTVTAKFCELCVLVSSVGGSRFYVTFIDDYTRKVWVYFLKHKSDVFSAFKKWKAIVENETSLKIKCFGSDNRGEYSSKEFVDNCAEQGIRMAKSMRLHADLAKMFWADSVNTAAYLINRGPSAPIGFKIPEEEWQDREISLKDLKVFGCISYVKIKDSERDKLEAKARKCTFIGYGLDDMGYRFWDNKNKKVIRSRDVVFNENALYKDEFSSGTDKQSKQKDQVELEEISDDDIVKPVNNPETNEDASLQRENTRSEDCDSRIL